MNELLKDRLQNPSFMDMEWPRGLFGEALDRIEALEAALRFYAENCSNGFNIYANLMGPSGDYGEIARAALGEKKE